jgi:DNA-binding NarL/FixJ family response regulator
VQPDFSDKITVLCVDDSPDLTALYAALINQEEDLTCIGTLPSADNLLDTVAELEPDLVLLDVSMPGRDPLEALRIVAREYPETRVILLSGYDDPQLISDAIDAGAWGLISKHGDFDAVLAALRTVSSGEALFPGERSADALTE